MCGIAGSINKQLDITRLTADLFHRGPDAQTTWDKDNLLLHHHRLAILDIACGNQPMHHNQYTIIFNGEIYNHLDVRKELDLCCKTNSDTETILYAYEKLGPDCLSHFDGMFALAIADNKKNELFLARDRAGKKPIYYYANGSAFVFCSELNALQHQVHDSINTHNISQFVRMGYFYRSYTPYDHISELPAGSYAIVSEKDPRPVIKKWWDIHPFYLSRSKDDFETAMEKTDQFIHAAVRRRVESSDLEVGSFLSGGIDSGIVSAIARKYNPSLKTFTVSFEGEYNEAPLAKLVADRYQTTHTEISISYDHLRDDVESILANYGEPFMDSSAIPSYYVSREAKKHLTVILNGDGGDEIFGGYRRYVPFSKYDFFRPGGFVKGMGALTHSILPAPRNKRSKYNYLYRLANLARKKSLPVYLSSTIDSFEDFDQYLVNDGSTLEEVSSDFEKINHSSLTGLQKIMNLDFDNILAGDLLVKMDIATMAHSLEGRSPLLSRELLEYIPGLPDGYKIKGSQTKYLLRKLAAKYLPAQLLDQPKRGFEIPLKKWVSGELKEIIGDNILSPNAYCTQFVKPGFIRDCWEQKIKCGDEKRAKILWTLFALETWYKKCYLSNA
jgi:asparagine synthase (glutamine-hydrolysing)